MIRDEGERRVTLRRATVIAIAVAVAVIGLPAGVVAATTAATSIADPVHPRQKARVSAQGRLLTEPCDANSCAAVDAGRLRVGDGSGALTVDGSVLTYPASAFSSMPYVTSGGYDYVKRGVPKGRQIMMTSITVRPNGTAPTQPAMLQIVSKTGANADCTGGQLGTAYYYAVTAQWPNSFTASFPSPIRISDRCAVVAHAGGDTAWVTITGYVV